MGWIAQRLQAGTRKNVVPRCVHGVSHRLGLVLFNDLLERIHVSSLVPLNGCLIIHRRSPGERSQLATESSNRLRFCRLYMPPGFGLLGGPCACMPKRCGSGLVRRCSGVWGGLLAIWVALLLGERPQFWAMVGGTLVLGAATTRGVLTARARTSGAASSPS